MLAFHCTQAEGGEIGGLCERFELKDEGGVRMLWISFVASYGNSTEAVTSGRWRFFTAGTCLATIDLGPVETALAEPTAPR